MADYECPWGGPTYLRGTPTGASRFRFSLLEDGLKAAYLEMEAGLTSMEREIVLDGVNATHVRSIYDAVRFDNPCVPHVSRMRTGIGYGGIRIFPTYTISRQAHKAGLSRMEEIGDRFTESVSGSGFERELAVHDHLSDTVLYRKDTPSDFSMRGPLLERRGACEGISKAALYLLRRCGVDAGIISGTTESGERHAWNMVHIDGGCYHLDITWDLGSRNGVTRHDYFNVNDGFMNRGRTWSDAYPSGSMDANYYSRRGTTVYRGEDLVKMIREFIARGQETIEFRICDALRERVDGKAVEESIRIALGTHGGRYSGCYNQSTGCCVFTVHRP